MNVCMMYNGRCMPAITILLLLLNFHLVARLPVLEPVLRDRASHLVLPAQRARAVRLRGVRRRPLQPRAAGRAAAEARRDGRRSRLAARRVPPRRARVARELPRRRHAAATRRALRRMLRGDDRPHGDAVEPVAPTAVR